MLSWNKWEANQTKMKTHTPLLPAFFLLSLIIILLCINYVLAVPVSPTVTVIGNSTQAGQTGRVVNGTGNDTGNPDKSGGFIFTINLDGISQNDRWKAYVGNVSGRLVLQDAVGWAIYDWTVASTLTGEIYATRASTTINWPEVNCSTATNTTNEEQVINHTNNPNDNLSRTFNNTDNSEFYVGNVRIWNNTCPTTNLFVNGTRGLNDDFEEVLLHDDVNMVYASIIEVNAYGYRNETFDFQMLLPERGYSGWASSTAYYFYVELN